MKIRLIGSADLVRAWAASMQNTFGITGREYPSRYASSELRVYFDLDDRLAESVIKKPSGPSTSGKSKTQLPKLGRRQ